MRNLGLLIFALGALAAHDVHICGFDAGSLCFSLRSDEKSRSCNHNFNLNFNRNFNLNFNLNFNFNFNRIFPALRRIWAGPGSKIVIF